CFFLHHLGICFHFVRVHRQADVDLVASRAGTGTRHRKPTPIEPERDHAQKQQRQNHSELLHNGSRLASVLNLSKTLRMTRGTYAAASVLPNQGCASHTAASVHIVS